MLCGKKAFLALPLLFGFMMSAPPVQAQSPVSSAATAPIPPEAAAETASSVCSSAAPPCKIEAPTQEAKQVAPEPPPKDRIQEERPTPPRPDDVWAAGYWYWAGARYVWVPGYWVAPRPGYMWVVGRWVPNGLAWVYQPGGWARVGTTTVVVRPLRPARWVWVRPAVRVPAVHPRVAVRAPVRAPVRVVHPTLRRASARRRVRFR